MRYYLNTQFHDTGTSIDLISIALVSEDNREYYAVNKNCDYAQASLNPWVNNNVLQHLDISVKNGEPIFGDRSKPFVKEKSDIAEEIQLFFGWSGGCYIGYDAINNLPISRGYGIGLEPEIWANYASYHWVAFCQIFGKMIELPDKFPFVCHDIQTLMTTNIWACINHDRSEIGNALAKARYCRQEHSNFLNKI